MIDIAKLKAIAGLGLNEHSPQKDYERASVIHDAAEEIQDNRDYISNLNDKIERQTAVIDANRKRIAELAAENAKLRGVIGSIPNGKNCNGCKKLSKINKTYCGLFSKMLWEWQVVGEDKIHIFRCDECYAAFGENGNKGE